MAWRHWRSQTRYINLSLSFLTYSIGGNYSPTILPQIEAAKQGYTQILWLFGPQGEVTEAGTMNFFMFWINKEGFFVEVFLYSFE